MKDIGEGNLKDTIKFLHKTYSPLANLLTKPMYSKEILDKSGLIEAGKSYKSEQLFCGTVNQWDKADFLRKEEEENAEEEGYDLDYLKAFQDCVNFDEYIESLKYQKGTNRLTENEEAEASDFYDEINEKMKS